MFPRMTGIVSIGVVLLFCFSGVALAESETHSQTTTGSQQTLRFSMAPPPGFNVAGYPLGNGSATVWVQGAFLSVHFHAEEVARGAHLMLVLTVDGTAHSMANMTTNDDGEVEAEGTISLAAGTHSVGLSVVDASTFSTPTVVLVSNPQTESLTLNQTTQTTQAINTGEETQRVSTVQGGATEDDGIRTAIQSKVIPAVVDVGVSGSSIHVNDGNFSVSIGRFQMDGYLISISAANVTGPRVLLINLTSSHSRSLFSGPVAITLDGSVVQPAASFTQVLGSKPGDPARFVLISGTSALQLLISIPHFSYHTIQIGPALVQIGRAILVDLPVVVLSVTAVSVMFVVAYSRRTRVVA